MGLKVALNGFGRIGRHVFRAHYGGDAFEIVAINDLFPPELMAYLLKYDSVYKTWDQEVKHDDDNIIVNGKPIPFSNTKKIEDLKWGGEKIDLVIEATGVFMHPDKAKLHLGGSCKKVVLTAPAKAEGDNVVTIVMRCNENMYDPAKHNIISNASCTTNCFAPMVKVLDDNFTIEKGLMTTIHAYTATQGLLDVPIKTKDRSRAAAINIIASTTGAAVAIKHIFPKLDGKLDAMSFRVPVPTVSVVDFVCNVGKAASKDAVNEAFKTAADGELKDIMQYVDDALVSGDFIGDAHSCSFDPEWTRVSEDGKLIKTVGWYDNEWGYSCRMVDLIKMIAQNGV